MNHSIKKLMKKPLTITLMQSTDFKEVNKWCIDEGWNIGIHDSDIYYKIDPLHHYIAKTDESVASLSLIKHSPSFLTLGPFIVHKLYRGQGVGEALWNKIMPQIINKYPDAHIALYAIPKQVDRYKKAGFTPVINIHRWHISPNQLISSTNEHCVLITKKLIPSLSQYYQNYSVNDGELLFKELLIRPQINGFVFMDDNIIKGFGFIRPCVQGFRIGALISDTPEIAKSLLTQLIQLANNASVIFDVPETNSHVFANINDIHLARVSQEDTVMMIKGKGYSPNLEQWKQHYGLFSLEIG